MHFPWRRKRIEADAIARDHWKSSFGLFARRRLEEEETADYRAWSARGRFLLLLKRQSLFAWAVNRELRFDDLVIEARASFEGANGHSALGFVLRYIDDSNFYYFLVSNRGRFRFDLVFNGNPQPLIEWVATPLISSEPAPIRLIARGPHFSFYVDDEWIGEVEDETLRSGRFGFAAQNYDEEPRALFRLERLSVEARPVEVERQYYRWVVHVPASAQQRLLLARSFAEREQFAAAAVQLRRALRGRRGAAEELFLFAECLTRLHLYREALEAVERTLAADPQHEGALKEKANLLYLLDRLPEADAHLEAVLPALAQSSPLWNLAGNVRYALGRFEAAEEAYLRAIELEPAMPLYRVNAARAIEIRGREPEALALFREAALQLFRQEAYDDLIPVLARIRRLAPADAEARALEAKVHYHEGRRREAESLLRELFEEGCEDSSVSYLYGMTLIERGSRGEALEPLRRAAALEPASSLYHFRLAETLRLLGEPCDDPLERARSLAPEDPWVNNLRGQLLLEQGRRDEAVEAFRVALRSLPEEPDVSANLALALAELERGSEADAVLARALASHPADSRLLNQRGNLAVRRGDLTAALADYEKALEADPQDTEIAKNLAAVCIETDMILRAEELLGWLTEQSPGPEVYNLVAHLALVQGERGRAELALKAGLELDPASVDLRLNLARLFIERRQVDRARETVEAVLREQPASARARSLSDRIHADWDQRLACAGCGRLWWAPREVPPQPALRLRGEPPADCPAGRCGRCGAVYCVGCASQHVVDGRMRCPSCGEPLKLDDDALRYLVTRIVEAAGEAVRGDGEASGAEPAGGEVEAAEVSQPPPGEDGAGSSGEDSEDQEGKPAASPPPR